MIFSSTEIFIITLVGSGALFLVFSFVFKRRLAVISGEMDPAIPYKNEQEIFYGIVFATPPKLDLKSVGSVDYNITSQTAQSFKLVVTGFHQGDKLKWTATGLPASTASDPRSIWDKLNFGQQVTLVTAVLALIGLMADLVGLWQFARGK